MDKKKYYYIKLKDNYFDQDNIKILEAMKNGHTYSLILIKMYLKASKYNGKLMMTPSIPYDPNRVEILANVIGHDVDHVRQAIRAGVDLDLITILDSGEIWMNEIQNFIGQSSTEADRIREYRNSLKQKSLPNSSSDSVQMYDKSTPELEKELELNKEKDIPHSTNADTQSKKQEDSESMKQAKLLSQFLFDECRRIDEKFGIGKDRVTVDRWAKDIEKLIRIDKRTFYEVKEVIVWAKAHHFWTVNIMSGVKLREKFPRLYTQMRKEKQDEEKKRPKTREEIYAEMVARYGDKQ